MVLRMSMEEERARQAQAQAAAQAANAAAGGGAGGSAPPATPATTSAPAATPGAPVAAAAPPSAGATGAAAMDEDEDDALLQQALAMSVQVRTASLTPSLAAPHETSVTMFTTLAAHVHAVEHGPCGSLGILLRRCMNRHAVQLSVKLMVSEMHPFIAAAGLQT